MPPSPPLGKFPFFKGQLPPIFFLSQAVLESLDLILEDEIGFKSPLGGGEGGFRAHLLYSLMK